VLSRAMLRALRQCTLEASSRCCEFPPSVLQWSLPMLDFVVSLLFAMLHTYFYCKVNKLCDNITTILFCSFFTFVVKENKLCYNYIKVLFQSFLVFIVMFCFDGIYVSLFVVKEHKIVLQNKVILLQYLVVYYEPSRHVAIAKTYPT
jgi:hypothetical protein